MIVAPRIDAASSTEPVSTKRGTIPASSPAGSGGAMNTPTVNPTAMITSNPITTVSNVRGPRRACRVSSNSETTPVMIPPQMSGTPNSRFSATAPPITSARSVAIATSSACTQ